MTLTPSTMLELGTNAADFCLPDTKGKEVCLGGFRESSALLVVFICNHCPYVIHIANALSKFANEYQSKGLGIVAISANDATNYPDDGPEKMAEEVKTHGYTFPYLYDEDQEVAKAYRAACTPDFFLFDAARKLVYRGQFDDSRPGNDKAITGADLRRAVDNVIAGQEPDAEQTPSMGCNIKWKPGNEPEYYG
ncbi:MAG: thioredoxin family protein [Acidiferrobacterales bacterium]